MNKFFMLWTGAFAIFEIYQVNVGHRVWMHSLFGYAQVVMFVYFTYEAKKEQAE